MPKSSFWDQLDNHIDKVLEYKNSIYSEFDTLNDSRKHVPNLVLKLLDSLEEMMITKVRYMMASKLAILSDIFVSEKGQNAKTFEMLFPEIIEEAQSCTKSALNLFETENNKNWKNTISQILLDFENPSEIILDLSDKAKIDQHKNNLEDSRFKKIKNELDAAVNEKLESLDLDKKELRNIRLKNNIGKFGIMKSKSTPVKFNLNEEFPLDYQSFPNIVTGKFDFIIIEFLCFDKLNDIIIAGDFEGNILKFDRGQLVDVVNISSGYGIFIYLF